MTTNGLSISEDEFSGLPIKQQNTILYHNTETLKRMVSSYKFQQKITYVWLSVITAVGSYLAIHYVGGL